MFCYSNYSQFFELIQRHMLKVMQWSLSKKLFLMFFHMTMLNAKNWKLLELQKAFWTSPPLFQSVPWFCTLEVHISIPGQNKQRKNWKVEEGWQGSVKGGGKGETEAHSMTNQFWAKAPMEAEDVEIGSVKMCTCWRCFMHLQRNTYPNMQTLLNVLQSALTQSFQTTLWETSYYSHLTDEVK